MGAETALPTAASVPAELLPHTQSGCNHNTALKSCKLTQKESKETDLVCFFTKRARGGEVSTFQTCTASSELLLSLRHAAPQLCMDKGGEKLLYLFEETLLLQPKEDAGIKKNAVQIALIPGTSNKVLPSLPSIWLFPVLQSSGRCTGHENWSVHFQRLLRCILLTVFRFSQEV